MGNIKYPAVKVKLTGEDGNAFAILARVQRALRRTGRPPGEIESFVAQATRGNYDHLLRTCMEWVDVS